MPAKSPISVRGMRISRITVCDADAGSKSVSAVQMVPRLMSRAPNVTLTMHMTSIRTISATRPAARRPECALMTRTGADGIAGASGVMELRTRYGATAGSAFCTAAVSVSSWSAYAPYVWTQKPGHGVVAPALAAAILFHVGCAAPISRPVS